MKRPFPIMYILSISLVVLPLFYSSQDIVLEIDGTATMIKKTWWGFKEEGIQLKSMNNQWYYLDKKTNEWVELLIDDGTMDEQYDNEQQFIK